LTVCTDRTSVGGLRAAELLGAIVSVLESGELVDEARADAAARPTPPAQSGLRALLEESTPAAASGE
ncbi:MAG: hypothetical protein ACREJ3_19005, partial [Polyangiaceae bacterium]